MDNYIRKMVLSIASNNNFMFYKEGLGVQFIKKLNDKGEIIDKKETSFSIKLSFKNVKNYPYCDTMKYQRYGTRKLTNKKLKIVYRRYENTDGNRTTYFINT